MAKRTLSETLTYAVFWILIAIAPVALLYSKAFVDTEFTFQWGDVIKIWAECLPFFLLFLIHDLIVAPLLVWYDKKHLYFLVSVALLAIFMLAQNDTRPVDKPPFLDMHHERHERMEGPPRPFFEDDEPPRGPHDGHRPPLAGVADGPALLKFMMAVFMLGMNIGIKYYFKSQYNDKKMRELEKQNLQQQLDALRYQINPHFFMNTLNNLHALIDIEPERAKHGIVELSQLMRYVLYRSSKDFISLSEDVDFMKNFIKLMRLRYTDRVKIEVDFPDDVSAVSVPPLLFISFIENAFKHGVSYRNDSFIQTFLRVQDEQIHFTCINSLNHAEEQAADCGIGLENVRQRLELIYKDSYTLSTEEKENTYEVSLTIPATI